MTLFQMTLATWMSKSMLSGLFGKFFFEKYAIREKETNRVFSKTPKVIEVFSPTSRQARNVKFIAEHDKINNMTLKKR